MDDCPDGYFAGQQQQECVRCHTDCASCNGPHPDDCEVCRDPRAVRYNGECVAQCRSNTYHDRSSNECRGGAGWAGWGDGGPSVGGEVTVPKECKGILTRLGCLDCDRSCLTCSGLGPASCLSCGAHRRRDASGHCVLLSQGDLTSYMDQNQQCHRTCQECSGPAENQCLSCSEPSFLLSVFCL